MMEVDSSKMSRTGLSKPIGVSNRPTKTDNQRAILVVDRISRVEGTSLSSNVLLLDGKWVFRVFITPDCLNKTSGNEVMWMLSKRYTQS
jgi:hypothetical protein